MRNIALLELGARLSQASSHHGDFPATAILDKTTNKPWISTGLFPQFFVITFPDLMQIQTIKIVAKQAKDVVVERSTSERIANYEEIAEKTLPRSDKVVEEMLSNEEITAQHLRFTFKSGYDHFVGIFSVEVMGSLASGRSPTTTMRKAASARVHYQNEDQEANDEDYDEDNVRRRKRFQSAFKVPTSNRPSHDMTHDPASASMWQDDYFEAVGGNNNNEDDDDISSFVDRDEEDD